MSVIFLEASRGQNVCIKERHTTNSKRYNRNVDVVYDLLVRIHRAKAIDANDVKIVTQYENQSRLYNLEYDNRARESDVTGKGLPQVVTLDTLRGHQAKVIIYDVVVTCGDKQHGLGIVNNELRACIAATRAIDTLIIVGSRELVTTFPGFWSWMNRRTGASDNPLPLIVRDVKSLGGAGLSVEPPTETRPAYAFDLKKAWLTKDKGFVSWLWAMNNTSGERE